MTKRPYRMTKRADARDETRERIIRATMTLHDELGVATTPYSAIAERSGVGAATIYRNFPTLEDLVAACGAHVWRDMRPPVPQEAPAVFKGLTGRARRLERLVVELDAFYRRGEPRLIRAAQDRHRVAGLDMFLTRVDAGVEALVRQALAEGASEEETQIVLATTDFRVWISLKRLHLPKSEHVRLMLRLLDCVLGGAAPNEPA
jgi:AcrR family transcriptional regulator